NGLGWSPDGSTMYFADTPTQGVDAFDFAEDGSISRRRRVVSVERGTGRPDGLTVDSEGCLWVAVFYGGVINRYSPNGELLVSVSTGAPLTTSCAFGGTDLRTLFLTSARIRLPPDWVAAAGISREVAEAGHSAPLAGGLFA